MTDTAAATATPAAADHTPPVHQHDAHAMFRSARDLLLEYRSDQAGARRQYQPPRPEHFNWALDWFHVVASTAAPGPRTALGVVDEDGTDTKVTYEQMASRSSPLASSLLAPGVKRGHRLRLTAVTHIQTGEQLPRS